MRFLLPTFLTLGLRKMEPIRLPPPKTFFACYESLRDFFNGLRYGGCKDETRKRAGELFPACDLIRFGGNHSPPIPEIELGAKQGMGSLINKWPEFHNFELWHTNLDFAYWAMKRMASGELDKADAEGIGYIYQHFPVVRGVWSKNPEVEEAWKLARAGKLPSPMRAKIRARMSW